MGNKNFQNGFALGFALRDRGFVDNYVKISKYATALTSMFYNADLPEELTLDVSEAQINSFKQIFQASYKHDLKKLTIIGDLSQATDYSYFVYTRSELKTIEGVIDFSSAANVNNMFGGTRIENATFAPNTLTIDLNISTVTTASDEMLISLANCLSTTTKATLSLSATSYNKCAAIYGTVDDDMFFTRTDNTSDVNLVDFISDAAYKGWQLSH